MSAIASRLRHLPSAASLCVIGVLLAAGAIYVMNFRQRESYLTGRNFRLLAVLAQQAESAIDDHAHARAADLHQPALPTSRRLERVGDQTWWLTLVFDSGRKKTKDPQPADAVLRPIFVGKIGQGAFDTLAVADPHGTLVLAVGRREWEISSMTLRALLEDPGEMGEPARPSAVPPGDAPTSSSPQRPPGPTFDRIAMHDAVVAGVPYKMFVQPCCRHVAGPEGATSGAVVVGLVATSALRDEAMAVSPTLVVIIILLIVLAGLAWPFLNVALQDHRKRITRWEAVQLGFSGTIGLAIATILSITSLQCARLESGVERQLDDLAAEIDHRLSEEIAAGAGTLAVLESWLASCPGAAGPIGAVVKDKCTPRSGEVPSRGTLAGLRDYHFAALIDPHGRQTRKARPATGAPTVADVRGRLYFKTALEYANGADSGADMGARAPYFSAPWVLDSVVAYGNGRPSAVLARPSVVPALPVAALTMPMASVIGPVLPPGFEFAVVEKSGRVVFHSDVQRNGFEDLFLETDHNPQLRALVASGVNGPVTTNYWGRPYLAHVRHAQPYGWSVVTLFNRRDLRGVMLEWTMVSVVLLAAYALLWAGALCLALGNGAHWLWPDRFRRPRYVLLGAFYLGLLAWFGWLTGAPSVERFAIAAAGFLLPALAVAVSVLVLRPQPAARVGTAGMDYRVGYCVPLALLLVVVGIVPGAAFVARSYDVHIEAYVKHRQLQIAQRMLAPLPADDRAAIQAPDGTARGTSSVLRLAYTDFLETSVCLGGTGRTVPPWQGATTTCPRKATLSACLAASDPHAGVAAPSGHGHGRDAFGALEAYLPFFSEMSVEIRELVHARADDGSWSSARRGDRTLLEVPAQLTTAPGAVAASTAVPPLALRDGADPWLLVVALLLLAGAYGVAYFIARYVFQGQVIAPSWALGRVAIPEGRIVVLLCEPEAMAPCVHGATPLALAPLVGAPDPQAALARAVGDLDTSAHRNRPILVSDLDSRTGGAEELAAKAMLLASLPAHGRPAVLALSSRPLSEWAESALSPAKGSAAAKQFADAIAALQSARVIELDWRAHSGAAAGPLIVAIDSGLRRWWRAVAAAVRRPFIAHRRVGPQPPASRPSPAEALIHAEQRAHLDLSASCDHVRRQDAFRENRMVHDEILEAIQEGAEPVYAKLWKRCSDDEKLELRHIAQFGLASPGNARAVRGLIARRLVTKDPNLRLMNRTFRRFVLSSLSPGHVPQRDVARIESSLTPSSWDRYSSLFVIAATGATAFLFITQRDAYNATIGAVVTLTTQLPNILKMVSALAQRDLAAPVGQRHA
jgi:hypothetical protein